MSMMLKDAAADDVTFGQWKISQLCSNLKETIDRSGDVNGYCPALELWTNSADPSNGIIDSTAQSIPPVTEHEFQFRFFNPDQSFSQSDQSGIDCATYWDLKIFESLFRRLTRKSHLPQTYHILIIIIVRTSYLIIC